MAEKNKTSILRKLVLTLLVAVGVAAASYFGLDLTEDDIINFVSPIVESVISDTAPVDSTNTNTVEDPAVINNDSPSE